MAQITAAVTAAAAAAVVSFRYFPPGRAREIPGLNFPARRSPAEVPANPPWTVTIFLYADCHVTLENERVHPRAGARP